MARRSSYRGLHPTGDVNVDQLQVNLSEQIDGLTLLDLTSTREVTLDGTATGTVNLGRISGYLVIGKDAAAHIYTVSTAGGTTVRSDAAVTATLLVF